MSGKACEREGEWMRPVRFFLGGPSQSGKSTAARRICEALGLLHIDLDKDPEVMAIKRRFSGAARSAPLRVRCLERIAASQTHSLSEGSPLRPCDTMQLARHDARFVSAFCGYPAVAAAEKLRHLEKGGLQNADHLQALSGADRLARIEKYITGSQALRQQCAEYGIAFFDLSDLATLDQGQTAILAFFEAQLRQLTTP